MKIDKGFLQAMSFVGQFGFAILAPALLLFWVGLRLDRLLDTNFLVIVFFFIGAFAGAWNIFRLVRKLDGHGRKEDGG